MIDYFMIKLRSHIWRSSGGGPRTASHIWRSRRGGPRTASHIWRLRGGGPRTVSIVIRWTEENKEAMETGLESSLNGIMGRIVV